MTNTLIAGLLSLAAGIIAFIGAMWAGHSQVAAVRDQIKDEQAARRQADERKLSVIKWAMKVEANRLEAAVSPRRRILPRVPGTVPWASKKLVIESSPLLRGEREELSLLGDQARGLLEKLAGVLDEYNSRIETAPVIPTVGAPSPEINSDILAAFDRLAEAVREMHSVM